MSDHRERREYNTKMSEDIASMKATLEALAGPYGRITKIEQSQTRQWWFTMCIGPVLAIAHAIARKFGATI